MRAYILVVSKFNATNLKRSNSKAKGDGVIVI